MATVRVRALAERIAPLLLHAGIENAEREAIWIAGAATDESEALAWAGRRAAGEPLQYILGSAPFRHLDLKVGPGAFIPRPETEEVAARALARLPQGGSVVDLCTGVGAIALAIARERPDARVYATEISEDALGWARRNAGDDEIVLLAGDLFDPLPEELRGGFDVVVSNPPYVAESEKATLAREIVDHEPPEALFAAEEGMGVIRSIAAQAHAWLRSGGWLVLEIGDKQADAVTALLKTSGYEDVTVSRDLAGKDRIAEARAP